jgi:uncharacterized membrane protein YesL
MFKRALSVTWFALRVTYEEFFALTGMGFLWFLVAVALPFGVAGLTAQALPWQVSLGLTALSLLLAPPATAAIYHVAWYLAHERRIEFVYVWHGFKEYFWWSWKVTGVMLVVGAILAADVLFFYRVQSGVFALVGLILMLWLLVFWIGIQVYLFPLMVALEEKRLVQMFKNSAQLMIAFPLFCLLMVLIALLSTVLSVVLVLLLVSVWMPFVAILFSRALASSWEEAVTIQQRHQAANEQEPEQAEE